MKTYLALYSARVRTLLQYRIAAIAGLSTQFFWGVLRLMIFEGFYAAALTPAPLSFDQVVTYVWLGQAFFRMIPWSADQEIVLKVRDGSVAYDLVKPVDLYWSWYSRALAMVSGPTLMRAAPILTAAWIFFGMKAPATTLHFLVWLPSITLGFVLSASIVTLISVSLFWTISGEGIARLLPAAVWMLSGIVVPVPLLPTSIRAVLELLPTSAIVDTPFRIYTGQYGPADFLPRLLLQAFWTMAFLAFGKAALARGVRRLVIQGG